jgi:hypothetical protein
MLTAAARVSACSNWDAIDGPPRCIIHDSQGVLFLKNSPFRVIRRDASQSRLYPPRSSKPPPESNFPPAPAAHRFDQPRIAPLQPIRWLTTRSQVLARFFGRCAILRARLQAHTLLELNPYVNACQYAILDHAKIFRRSPRTERVSYMINLRTTCTKYCYGELDNRPVKLADFTPQAISPGRVAIALGQLTAGVTHRAILPIYFSRD